MCTVHTLEGIDQSMFHKDLGFGTETYKGMTVIENLQTAVDGAPGSLDTAEIYVCTDTCAHICSLH